MRALRSIRANRINGYSQALLVPRLPEMKKKDEKQKLKQILQNQLETEEELGKQLQQKYGDGNIDLEKGEFIPSP